MPTTVRRLVLVSTLIAAMLGAIGFISARYVFPGQESLAAVILLLTLTLVAVALWQGALAFLSRLFAGGPTLLDRVSIEPMVALFLLPTTTAITGLAVSLAATGADILDEWRPDAGISTDLVVLEVIVIAAVVSLLAPLVALAKVADSRQGRAAALFDPTIDDTVFQNALDERWSRLRGAPRRWLSTQRLAALGDENHSADRAWPTQLSRISPTHLRLLSGLPWLAAVAAALSLLIFAAAVVARPGDHLPDPNATPSRFPTVSPPPA